MNLGLIGLLLGASFASGLNLYATVATLGLLHRFDVIALPASLHLLAHPAVVWLALALYVVEFAADKIPAVDHVWDVVHTFVRPPAAALLAYAAVASSPVPDVWRLVAALLAGTVAFTAHATKATARGAVNASPEPFSRAVISVGEDILAVTVAWLAAAHPVVAIVTVAILLAGCIALLLVFVRVARGVWRRLFGGRSASNEKPAPV